jgi:hypothetical protein
VNDEFPAAQSLQVVLVVYNAFSGSEYVPAGQKWQTEAPSKVYVPTLQFKHTVELREGENWPAGQRLQLTFVINELRVRTFQTKSSGCKTAWSGE